MKQKAVFFGIVIFHVLIFNNCTRPSDFPVLKGPYLGHKSTGMTPGLFAPEIFTREAHVTAVFSPDGKELYWNLMSSRQILFMFITSFWEENTINNDPTYWKEKIENVTDIDGNVYRTAMIGTQVWIVENLKVTHYRDGTPIPNVQDNEEWSLLKTGAYCLYEDNPSSYKKTYGALYNFHAVNDSRGLCPEGWHVPTATEWRELIDYLGGDDVAGGKMKDISSNLWKIPTPGSSNESGFYGLPAGGRGRLGSAGEVGYYATWWSSTSYDSIYTWHWGLYPDKNSIRSNPGHKASGFSVRCVKDQ